MKVLITTSGTGSRLGEITNYINKSLVKVGDKFVIDYIIDYYKYEKNIQFIITLGYKGYLVKQYLQIAYDFLDFVFINIDNYEGIGSSLGYSLLACENILQEPFYFHCCDTILLENFETYNENTCYIFKSSKTDLYSSVKIKNKEIVNFFNKGELNVEYIYIGLSFIKNYVSFWENLSSIYKKNPTNSKLSDINVYIEMLKNNEKINYKIVENYYDIGSVQNYFTTNKIMPSKYNVIFKNQESISFHEDKVIKFFYDKEKNLSRLHRIKYLINTPRILKRSENFHSMELINSKPLSEIYERGLIKKLLNWSLSNLWTPEKCENFKILCENFYYKKTYERIENYKYHEYDIINGIKIRNLKDIIKEIPTELLTSSRPTRFHGDFILDNILLKDYDFVLIDWRQDFGGNTKSGDKYYDLAKLKHNIILNHKNIKNQLFNLVEKSKNECILDVKCNYFLIEQLEDFDQFIKEKNLSAKKIDFLKSLIWINMAPLHEYPLSEFLFNFGKYNLFLTINQYKNEQTKNNIL